MEEGKGRARKSLQKLTSERGTGKEHLFRVYNSEKAHGVMIFNSASDPTSCVRSGPLPGEATDDGSGGRGEPNPGHPLKPKLKEGDAGANRGQGSQSRGESKRCQA